MLFFEVPIEFTETVLNYEEGRSSTLLESEGEVDYREMTSPYPYDIFQYIKRDDPILTYDPSFFRIISHGEYKRIYQFNTTSGFDSVRRQDYDEVELSSSSSLPSIRANDDDIFILVNQPHPNLHWFLLNVDIGDVEGQPSMKILPNVKYPDVNFLHKILDRLKQYYPSQWESIIDTYFPEDYEDVISLLMLGDIVQDSISNVRRDRLRCFYLTSML